MTKRSLLAILAILCGLGLMLSLSAPAFGQAKAKDTYILKGAPMGGVKFEHKLHVERGGDKCEVCHHASKPEKALTHPHQACTECHTKTAAAPMKTTVVGAFHKNAAATAGVCIDCHKADNAKGKKAPVKCMDCHKKENI